MSTSASDRLSGIVTAFDAYVGLGDVETDDGRRFLFHCIAIADGTRTIDVGARVSFLLVAKLGRLEAHDLRPT